MSSQFSREDGEGAGAAVVSARLRSSRDQLAVRPAIASSFGRRDYLRRRLLSLADLGALVIALAATTWISSNVDVVPHLAWGLALLPVWLLLFAIYGLYARDIKRISHSTVDDVPWLLHAVLVACLLTWVLFTVLPVRKLVFSDVLVLGGLATAVILIFRWVVRSFSVRRLSRERVVFIGRTPSTDLLARKMTSHPEYGLSPVATLAPRVGEEDDTANGAPEEIDLAELLVGHRADRVVVSENCLGEEDLVDLIHLCKELSLKVSVLPQLFSAMGPSLEVDDIEGMTVLGINPPVLPRSARIMKRALDLLTATPALVISAPLMGLIAIAIKLESRGPVFFRQRRIGRGGRPFELVKFRTMPVGAEEQTATLLGQSLHKGWLKLERDPRVTRLGRFLRLTSLDELPQLWTIVRGQMSLVGPRPLIESEDRQVAGWARSRLELTPGLTGLWQVLGRTNIPFEEMVKLDYLYVTNWSLWTDVRLIVRTFPVVLTRRGAN